MNKMQYYGLKLEGNESSSVLSLTNNFIGTSQDRIYQTTKARQKEREREKVKQAHTWA